MRSLSLRLKELSNLFGCFYCQLRAFLKKFGKSLDRISVGRFLSLWSYHRWNATRSEVRIDKCCWLKTLLSARNKLGLERIVEVFEVTWRVFPECLNEIGSQGVVKLPELAGIIPKRRHLSNKVCSTRVWVEQRIKVWFYINCACQEGYLLADSIKRRMDYCIT